MENPKLPVHVVVGTRPEAIKRVPLIGAGWSGRQELRAVVGQQALPGLRRLLRQRARCGALMGCVARGVGGALKGILVAQVYAFYTWLPWPVIIRATARQLTDRRSWAKTEREVVTDAAGPPRRPAARA